jgi:hypothetical protein
VKLATALDKADTKPTDEQPPQDFSAKGLTIIEAMESKKAFRPLFDDLSTWQHWEVFLKSLYSLPMDEEERKFFKECTQRDVPNQKGYREAYCIAGRRAGKSRMAALIASFEAIFGDWQRHLSKGERGWIFCIGTDKTQAKIVLDYIKGVFDLFPQLVEKALSDTIELKNNLVITVKTCSFRASRGFSTAVICADELAFWRSEQTLANPAEEVIASLLPGLLPGGLLLGLSTPYGKFGYLYETYKEHYGKNDSDVLVWQAGTRQMNPTYHQSLIDRLLKKDRTKMTSEYNATFREDVSNFISEEILDAITQDYICLPPQAGIIYKCFVDPSGGRNDSFAFSIAHKEGQNVIVDLAQEFLPPFDPAAVAQQIAQVLREYKITRVQGDRFAGNWVSGAFRKEGIFYENSPVDKSSLFLEFQAIASMRRVSLPKHETMRAQFLSLERLTHSGGKDVIQHPLNFHDDICNTTAGAVAMTFKELSYTLTEKEIESRLPTVIKNETAERLIADIRGGDYIEKKRNQSAAEEMDSWMREGGGSRIVK